jgi:hypothetical protein
MKLPNYLCRPESQAVMILSGCVASINNKIIPK